MTLRDIERYNIEHQSFIYREIAIQKMKKNAALDEK